MSRGLRVECVNGAASPPKIPQAIRCLDTGTGSGAGAAGRGLPATPVSSSPASPSFGRNRLTEQWVHEIKHDGYRIQVHLHDTGAKAYTRRGNDWSSRFKPILAATGLFAARSAVLDGEVVVETASGHSDFAALQDDLGARRSDRLVFYAFDLLHLDGFELRGCSLLDRKRVLYELIGERVGPIRVVEHLEGDGRDIYRNACKLKLEGVVSKLATGKYESGRSRWVKVTCRQRETFPIVGYSLKDGKFDGLYLGRETKGGLEYAGKVENGFDGKTAKSVVERLKPLIVRAQRLAKKVDKPKAKWVKPDLLAEVEFRALTGERKVRHPSFKGLREDL